MKIRIVAFAAILALAMGGTVLADSMGTAKPSASPHPAMSGHMSSASGHMMKPAHSSKMSSHMSSMSGHGSMMKASPKASPTSHP